MKRLLILLATLLCTGAYASHFESSARRNPTVALAVGPAFGTISAANVGTFPTITANSSVGLVGQNTQYIVAGSSVMVQIPTNALNATLHVYFSPDGASLQQIPDAGIYRWDTGASGAIAASTAATYTVNVPQCRAVYVIASAYSLGSAIVQIATGPAMVTSSGGSSGGGTGVVPTGGTYEGISSNGTPITTATTTQIFAAQAGAKHHVWIQFSNSSTTGTVVQLLDGSTVISETYCAPSGGGLSDAIPLPLYGSTNTSFSIKVITAGASIYWTARGYYL